MLAVLAALAITALATPGRATVDGGREARLLGVASDRAVVVEVNLQVECSEVPCRAYAVDLSRARQGRSGDRMIAEATLEAYLGALGKERAALADVVPVARLEALMVEGDRDALTIRSRKGELTLTLAIVARADSMAAYERTSDRPCLDPATGRPLCQECQETTRFVWGREASFWACSKTPGPWRGEPSRALDCDCHAEATIVELRLEGAGPGTGSQILAAPHQLGQNVVGGTRAQETTDLALIPRVTRAHQTARGDVVVTGAVAHAPEANGTYFPMIASTRFSPSSHDAGNGASDDSRDGEVGLPRSGRPRGAACRGCAIDDGAARSSWLLLAAGIGIFAARRRRSA
jgi:MYXO-CTERM domain-containing protein